MIDRTGGLRMICPRCGIEQPRAEECANCGIVVAKYKRHRLPRPTAAASAGLLIVGLLVAIGVVFVLGRMKEGAALLEVSTPAAGPQVGGATDLPDPTGLETYWAQGAGGFRGAVQTQMEQKQPLVVWFRPEPCPACAPVEPLLESSEVRMWLNQALRVRIDPASGPDEAALAEKFGVTATPALYVVRTNGERRPVATPAAGTTPEAFLSTLRAAAGR